VLHLKELKVLKVLKEDRVLKVLKEDKGPKAEEVQQDFKAQ
jgi:hypothetical protein